MSIGMNFHSPSLDNPEGLRSLDLRWALFLADSEEVWNSTTHLWAEVKTLCPRCKPIVRFYRPNVMRESPERRAEQFCRFLGTWFGDQPVDAIPGNEPNEKIEHGDKERIVGELQGVALLTEPWNMPDSLAFIADWSSRYADAHRALRPQDILHLPACSAWMPFKHWLVAMPVDKFDVVDAHVYDLLLRVDWLTITVKGLYRKPLAVTEWGKIGGTPEEYAAFARALGDTMNCIWKWAEPKRDGNPDGDPAGYAIANRQDVVEGLARIAQEGTHGRTNLAVGTVNEHAMESGEVAPANPGDPPADRVRPAKGHQGSEGTVDNRTFKGGREGGTMTQQEYLDIISDIWTTAKRIRALYSPRGHNYKLPQRIMNQCEILDDLKIQEAASQPPFRRD